MAKVIIPVGYARICVRWRTGGGQRSVCSIFGVKLNDVVTNTAVSNLSGTIGGAFKPNIGNTGYFFGIEVLVGQDGTDPLFFQSTTGNAVGTGNTVTSVTSPQVQTLCKKTSALAGRKNRGRTFLTDVAESEVDGNGNLNAAASTRLTTFCSSMMTALGNPPGSTSPWDGMVILHTAFPPSPTPINSYIPETRVATLRPRYVR